MRIKIFGALFSVLTILYVLKSVDWATIQVTLKQVSIVDLFILVAIYLSGFTVRALRSQLMLPQPGLFKSGAAVIMGYAANNLLPARLGEFVRAGVVNRISGVRSSIALASIGVERMLDGLSLVILLFIGAAGLNLPAWVDKVRLVGLLIFGSALIFCLVAGFYSDKITKFIPDNKIGHIFSGLLSGLVLATRSIAVTVSLVLLSLLVWCVESSMFLYGFHVFGFPLGIQASLVVLGIINLGLLIPSSPGFIGVFQFFTIQALSLFAINQSDALAYGVTLHICQYLPITLIGLILLQVLGLRSFKELARKTSS